MNLILQWKGDNTVYSIDETLMNNMLPDEDVYKPKKKETIKVLKDS